MKQKPKILHLTLHKKWFDQILEGTKKVEYREIKPYWTKRLFDEEGQPKKYDFIIFRNGYSKDAPIMKVEFKGVREGILKENVGMKKGVKVYEILLGYVELIRA